MPSLRFARAETSVGPMWVAETDRGVAAISRDASPDDLLGSLRRRFRSVRASPGHPELAWLTDALAGGPLPAVDLRGLSPFDARVYAAVRLVPSGSTVTYGDVAVVIGAVGAARAVGGALARCPLFPAVPCHRVVRASDGWSGWGSDVALKRWLLAAERATAPGADAVASRMTADPPHGDHSVRGAHPPLPVPCIYQPRRH